MSEEPAPEVSTEAAPPVVEPAAAEPAPAAAEPAPAEAAAAPYESAPVQASAPAPAGGRTRGTVLRWNPRGFGFLKCDGDGDDGEDLFCHYSGITDVSNYIAQLTHSLSLLFLGCTPLLRISIRVSTLICHLLSITPVVVTHCNREMLSRQVRLLSLINSSMKVNKSSELVRDKHPPSTSFFCKLENTDGVH